MSSPTSLRTLLHAVFIAAVFGPGASATEIRGTVRTQNGQPVSQAAVRLAAAGASHEAVTGSLGEFRLDLPEGSYVATVRGFDVDPSPIAVAGGEFALDIALRPAKLREEVVVAATRSRTAISSVGVSASVLGDEDLRERQTLQLTDALAEVPGLSVASTGGVGAQSSLFVRGGESRFARVLIDGVPVNEPGGFFNFGTLLTPDVERVEVVRGSFGTLYGSDALAGVVALETAPLQAERRLRGSVSGGDLGSSAFSVAGSGVRGPLSGVLSVGGAQTDNEGPNEDFQSLLLAASFERRFSNDGSLTGSFRLNTSEGGTPGPTVYGRPDLDARYERDLMIGTLGTRFRSGRVSHSARIGFKSDDQLSTNPLDSGPFTPTSGSQKAPFDSYDYPNPLGYANNTERIFGTYELRAQAGKHSLTMGGDLEHETGELGNVGEPPLSPTRTSYGAFLQDQLSFTPRAFATLSVRAEHNGSTGTTLVPHASFAWVAAQGAGHDLTLRASGGAGIKAPSFFESYGESSFALGNPDLKPERGRTYDVGADLRFTDGLKVQATYFYHQYLDQIAYKVVTFDPFVGTYENLGETRAQGLELAAEWRPSSHVRFLSNYTRLDTEIVTSVSTDPALAVGQPLRRRPKHQGSVTGEGTLGRATLGLTVASVSDQADSDFLGIGLTENPGHTRLDLRAAVRLASRARILAAMENATDADYQEVLGYQALPRRFRISLSLDSKR